MREILFRGKRKDNGEWVYGGFCRKGERVFIITSTTRYMPDTRDWDIAEYYENNPIYKSILIEVIPETVGQYIGTEDKRGTKVFEGDILDMEYFEGICLVAFNGSSFGYKHRRDLEKENTHPIPFDDSEYGYLTSGFAIVGNIHDNPELMKTE